MYIGLHGYGQGPYETLSAEGPLAENPHWLRIDPLRVAIELTLMTGKKNPKTSNNFCTFDILPATADEALVLAAAFTELARLRLEGSREGRPKPEPEPGPDE